MPKKSALQFAEQGQFSQSRAFAGQVLYAQGMAATHMYVIKDGEVDLYLVRDEKRTVVETLRKGQCFGLEPHLASQVRIHNAAARTDCELFLIDNKTVHAAISDSSQLVQSMLDTLSERLSVTHMLIATRVNDQPDLLIYARMLHLLGAAEVGKHAFQTRANATGNEPVLARPLLQEVFVNARALFGHSDRHVQSCLSKLMKLQVLRVEDLHGTGKRVVFSPQDIVSQVRNMVSADALAAVQKVDYPDRGQQASFPAQAGAFDLKTMPLQPTK